MEDSRGQARCTRQRRWMIRGPPSPIDGTERASNHTILPTLDCTRPSMRIIIIVCTMNHTLPVLSCDRCAARRDEMLARPVHGARFPPVPDKSPSASRSRSAPSIRVLAAEDGRCPQRTTCPTPPRTGVGLTTCRRDPDGSPFDPQVLVRSPPTPPMPAAAPSSATPSSRASDRGRRWP